MNQGQENLAFQVARKNSALMRVRSKEEKLKTICKEQEFDLHLREKQIERLKNLKTNFDDRQLLDPISNLDEYVLKAKHNNVKENDFEGQYYPESTNAKK